MALNHWNVIVKVLANVLLGTEVRNVTNVRLDLLEKSVTTAKKTSLGIQIALVRVYLFKIYVGIKR